MGSYRYCDECDVGMDKPTPQEDLIDGQPCPACGHIQRGIMSEREWIVDLFEQLEELRAEIKGETENGK